MSECIFCKLIKGELPSYKIHENEKHFAFLDINPLNDGHLLIIPKRHENYIFDLTDKEYQDIFSEAKKLAGPLKKATKAKRIAIVVEGLEVPHVHVHLIPLYGGDALVKVKPKPIDHKKLNEIAERIRKEL